MSFLNLLDVSDMVSVISDNLSAIDIRKLRAASKHVRSAVDDALDDTYFRHRAVQHFGALVLDCQPADGPLHGWRHYYMKRCPLAVAPQSECHLVQEGYGDCQWKLLCVCIICSRTSSGPAVRATASNFFTVYPNPSAVIRADEGDLQTLLHVVGMQPQRTKALKRMSAAFLETDFQSVDEFFGIGQFGKDSWNIFCMNAFQDPNFKSEDKSLKLYLSNVRGQTMPNYSTAKIKYMSRTKQGQIPKQGSQKKLPPPSLSKRATKPATNSKLSAEQDSCKSKRVIAKPSSAKPSKANKCASTLQAAPSSAKPRKTGTNNKSAKSKASFPIESRPDSDNMVTATRNLRSNSGRRVYAPQSLEQSSIVSPQISKKRSRLAADENGKSGRSSAKKSKK